MFTDLLEADVEGRAFLGIDPGKTGGLALLSERGRVIACRKMPEEPADLARMLRGWWGEGLKLSPDVAVLERVNAGVWGKAGAKQGQSMGVVSAFTFGRGFGRLEGILETLELPYTLVMPVTWQTALDCRTGGNKAISKAKAQELFPYVPVTHAVGDALLLAEYCRRHGGLFI